MVPSHEQTLSFYWGDQQIWKLIKHSLNSLKDIQLYIAKYFTSMFNGWFLSCLLGVIETQEVFI